MIQRCAFCLLFLLGWTSLSANLPEHADQRFRNRNLIFAPIDALMDLLLRPSLVPKGKNLHLRIEESGRYVYLVFSPQEFSQDASYPRGTYIIRRAKSDGAFSQIKILLSRDGSFAVRIFPDLEGVRIKVTGAMQEKHLFLPLRFETMLLMPFAQLQDITAHLVDWSYFLPDVYDEQYLSVEYMVEELRRRLPELPDAEDGAMDEYGNLVFIESLSMQEDLPGFNCSGFAKWVIDGLYEPKYGRLLSLDALKVKHREERGTKLGLLFEEERDPYFGLDWTRNLAAGLKGIEYRDDRSVDVTSVPFAYYHEDVGYEVKELASVLYWLAIHEPGFVYMGSINREFGADPVLRQHIHVVMILPYFDAEGVFHMTVMERNVESSVPSLERRYADSFIHLVRVSASGEFHPPSFRLQ